MHTEDIDPFYTDKALVMSVDIIGTDGKTTEKWTEYIVPGEFMYDMHTVTMFL